MSIECGWFLSLSLDDGDAAGIAIPGMSSMRCGAGDGDGDGDAAGIAIPGMSCMPACGEGDGDGDAADAFIPGMSAIPLGSGVVLTTFAGFVFFGFGFCFE